jgi:hypothetical protein
MLDGVSFKTQPIGFYIFHFKSKPIDISLKNICLALLTLYKERYIIWKNIETKKTLVLFQNK